MLNFDLMDIFNGFIKNYINFGLNKESDKFEVVKRENKYFIMLGQLLGYSVISKVIKENQPKHLNNVEMEWKNDDFNKLSDNINELQLFREFDLINDLLSVQNLLEKIKEDPNKMYIQILETSSSTRIDYLNNIVNTSQLKIEKDILLIYIIRDILNNTNYYSAYLFEKGKMSKSKIGICYYDAIGDMKAKFKS